MVIVGGDGIPNSAEMELRAIHSSIAEIKRQMDNCVNVKHYQELEKKLQEFEQMRLDLLNKMEVEI